MKTRYSFGGDEHIFVEVDEEMSLEAFFKSLFITNAVKDSKIKGITEICPANASFQVKFDPDVIKPDAMLAELKSLESAAEKASPVIDTRIIEIPVFYQDPWTHETLMRFRERHQDPDSTDIEYAAATGTPEGNGLMPEFVRALTKRITRALPMIGADLVEVAPPLTGGRPGEPETTLATASDYLDDLISAGLVSAD